VLVVSERLPRPDESAGSRRLLTLLALVARHHPVDLWIERDETTGHGALSRARVAEARTRLATAGVHVLAGGWRPLIDALSGPSYAVALFEFHAMAARYADLVRGRQGEARVIVDSVDLHFARLAAGAAIGVESARRARRMRRLELATYRAADAVLVASSDDALTLSAEGDLPAVYCVPTIASIRPRAEGPRDREALFVGHFDHAPNVDGLRWFVDDVWPRVCARDPHARLTVVGTQVPDAVRAFGSRPGVSIVGYVPDVTPFLDRARLSIAPLRYGAGMKGKVTEAMAAGVPVVSTPVGVQGLGVVSSEHALIAEEASSFAAAVTTLFDDPSAAECIGLAGQQHVSGICSAEVVEPQLRRLLEETLDRPPRRTAVRHAAPAAALTHWVRRWLLAGRHAAVTSMRRQAQWLIHRA